MVLEIELGDIPQKNRKEGIFVIPVSKSSKKFYTGKPTYRKNTGILSKYQYTVKYRYGHRHIYTNSLLFSLCACSVYGIL